MVPISGKPDREKPDLAGLKDKYCTAVCTCGGLCKGEDQNGQTLKCRACGRVYAKAWIIAHGHAIGLTSIMNEEEGFRKSDGKLR